MRQFLIIKWKPQWEKIEPFPWSQLSSCSLSQPKALNWPEEPCRKQIAMTTATIICPFVRPIMLTVSVFNAAIADASTLIPTHVVSPSATNAKTMHVGKMEKATVQSAMMAGNLSMDSALNPQKITTAMTGLAPWMIPTAIPSTSSPVSAMSAASALAWTPKPTFANLWATNADSGPVEKTEDTAPAVTGDTNWRMDNACVRAWLSSTYLLYCLHSRQNIE